ncbi:MAG: autotransporter outer membrane beta-barrel domain-containing protein [Desulfobacteraceae bacterium]|nr:autotransporter outer membrane beta-barrel domain-containing protein [Desulfobacteraceae bacterium]
MKHLTFLISLLITVSFIKLSYAENFNFNNHNFYAENSLPKEDYIFSKTFETDNFSPEFHPPSEPSKIEELYRINPYGSYDTKIKYKLDFNIYDKKLEIIPKLRIKRTLEEKITRDKDDSVNELTSKTNNIYEESSPSGAQVSSSLTNSIYVGMDLSYAINKNIYIDSNLSFYQTDMELSDKDPKSRVKENTYKYEGNAMTLSIGVRKKLTSSFSAGLIYSWEKWLNETEDFKISDPDNESKASEDAQEALNLILRYDF